MALPAMALVAAGHMDIEELIQFAALLSRTQLPNTVPELIAECMGHDAATLGVACRLSLSPRRVGRYAWTMHRQALLVGPVLGEQVGILLCGRHAADVREYAATMYVHPSPWGVRHDLLQALVGASLDFWTKLREVMDDYRVGTVAWPASGSQTLRWLRFCMTYLVLCIVPDGSLRSRRELAAMLADKESQATKANTIRLRSLPRVEHECANADRWAASLRIGATREIVAG